MPNQFRAVLFDLDGVLVDSVAANTKAYEIAFSDAGCAFGDAGRAAVAEGKPRELVIEAALDSERRHLAPVLFEAKQAVLTELLQHGLDVAMPGALEAVAALRTRGMRLGVVTNSCAPALWLDAIGLGGVFDTVISGADVAAPKPDPSGYRLALQRLRVQSNECLAIEDSEDGWRAARDAGLDVWVLASERPMWLDSTTCVVSRWAEGPWDAARVALGMGETRNLAETTENDNSPP